MIVYALQKYKNNIDSSEQNLKKINSDLSLVFKLSFVPLDYIRKKTKSWLASFNKWICEWHS